MGARCRGGDAAVDGGGLRHVREPGRALQPDHPAERADPGRHRGGDPLGRLQAGDQLGCGRPQAGKTGTTNNTQSVWFAGYTPDMAGVAYIAADVTSSRFKGKESKPIVGLRMSTGKVLEGSGGQDAGGIWKSAMSEALKDIPASNFQEPNKRILEGEKVPVPSVAGMTEEPARQTLEAEGFSVGRTEQFSPQPAGTYLGKVFPSTRAAKYSTVQLVYSKGPIPTDTPTVAPGQPGQPSAPATPEGER